MHFKFNYFKCVLTRFSGKYINRFSRKYFGLVCGMEGNGGCVMM